VSDVATITKIIALAGGLKDAACRKSLLALQKQVENIPPAVPVDPDL
jgi:hypothetical protein